ncbi:hypothetical protein GDO86_018519 [Hymenochirus boettgeri]|uniref:Uncharacterized protein n=1 Tax=Hymenochirus boettgeri TaxID=247094 RepID=A0A8T2ILM5_9PIPI|nr:hypothetical protein GDO86_018519 [Hymenochirus boettgeri]
MASADMRDELSCSICTDIYTDPVTLPCGHNYCQGCIGKTWDWQEKMDKDPSCPECRRRYRRRPELERNLRLRNIAERFRSTHPEHHGIGDRNCSIHNDLLKYYCYVDGVCVCASCGLVGDHRGHKVELLGEASEKKKEKLRNVLDKLTSEREETEKRVQSLQENRREGQERAAGDTETVTALFRDIREQLEALEKRVLSEISRQENEFSLTLTDLIQQLEIKNNELSRKIHHIEELCSMADPLTVLQDQESDGAAICGAEDGDNEDRERDDMKVPVIHDSNNIKLPHVPSCNRIRISLDYEAGRLSFYELSDPIRHLHTFTAPFTESLHGAFWVYNKGTWVRIVS